LKGGGESCPPRVVGRVSKKGVRLITLKFLLQVGGKKEPGAYKFKCSDQKESKPGGKKHMELGLKTRIGNETRRGPLHQ